MQTEHYMANMGKHGDAERLGPASLEGADDCADIDRQPVAAALDLATTGRSAGTSARAGTA